MGVDIDLSDVSDILRPLGRYLRGAKDGRITNRERRKLDKALEELAEIGSEEFEQKIAEDPDFARDVYRAGKRLLALAALLEILDGGLIGALGGVAITDRPGELDFSSTGSES